MSTLATVVALHNFEAENDDELPFEAGEKIEVLEKDDIYGDGWWRGRNASGLEGLFPASYISEGGADVANEAPGDLSGLAAAAGVLTQPGANGQHSPTKAISRSRPASPAGLHPEPTTPGGTVMRNTIGDVQAAINSMSPAATKQISAGDGADDESLAPSHSGAHLDRDSDDEDGGDIHNPIWSQFGNQKDTRTKLAEQAKIENERKEQEEREKRGVTEPTLPASNGNGKHPTMEPPSDLVYSDESEDEEDKPAKALNVTANQEPAAATEPAQAKEEPSGNGAMATLAGAAAAGMAGVGVGIAAVADAVGLHAGPPGTLTPQGVKSTKDLNQAEQGEQAADVPPANDPAEPPQSVKPSAFNHGANAYFPNEESPLSTPFEAGPERSLAAPLSSATAPMQNTVSEPVVQALTTATPQYAMAPPPVPGNTISAVTPISTSSNGQLPATAMTRGLSEDEGQQGLSNRISGANVWASIPGPPTIWTVAQVVEWAKLRGFDEAICEKFEEHEITGDVLVELDANLLKELDIPQFGKRLKIANAIAELRRPTSQFSGIQSARSSQQVGSSGRGGSASMPPGSGGPYSSYNDGLPIPSHTPTSQGGGYASTPVSPAKGQYAQDYRQYSSTPPLEVQRASGNGIGEYNLAFSPESEPKTDEINQMGSSPRAAPVALMHGKAPDGVGLGFGQNAGAMGAIAGGAAAAAAAAAGGVAYSEWAHSRRTSAQDPIKEEDETGPSRMAGRILAATPEIAQGEIDPSSGATNTLVGSGGSLHSSVPPSPSTSTNPKRISGAGSITGLTHKKNKASIDGAKPPSERGSFFGGNLGRNRKPAPRYPSGASGINIDKDVEMTPDPHRRSLKGLIGQPKTFSKEASASPDSSPIAGKASSQGTALQQIGKPDHAGFMKKKGERYNSWKLRYFVLKGPHLYYMKDEREEKVKGHIDLAGYKVLADGNSNPGSYGFQIVHDREKAHYFSSNDHRVVKEWMKNLMKATISRDYSAPVVSSCNIPTIPLREAQMMSPAPRPPSPAERDATQKASRRDNPNQLTARDASVLMSFDNGVPTSPTRKSRTSLNQSSPTGPPRPSRDSRRQSEFVAPIPSFQNRSASDASFYSPRDSVAPPAPMSLAPPVQPAALTPATTGEKQAILEWVNAHLPPGTRKATNVPDSFTSGELINRVIEHICGAALTSPPASDDAFIPVGSEVNIEGLFTMMDRCIDEGVDTVGVSINDIRLGHAGETAKLLESLRAWGESKHA